MRVIATADLNYKPAVHPYLEQLASDILDENPDLFLVGGNVGEPLSNFETALALFEAIDCPKALVTGNRDVWHRQAAPTSQQLWEELLPAAIRQHGFIWLEQENLAIDRVGVCGTVGWYDYSARDPGLGYNADQYEELKGLVNKDAHYIDWPWTDRQFASRALSRFATRIEELERDRVIDRILVLTHFPVFKECVVVAPDDPEWNFGIAYALNLSLGRVIAPKTKVQHVISGHVRPGGHWEVRFGGNTINMHIVKHIEYTDGKAGFVSLEL